MKKIVVLLLVISACTSNTIYKKPDDLIPKDTMVMLLQDLMIANSATFVKNNNQQMDVNYMPFVYQKYKIDSARFAKSNKYYITVVDEYIKIFEAAEKNLTRRKDSLTKLIQTLDSIRKDSIFKAGIPKTTPVPVE